MNPLLNTKFSSFEDSRQSLLKKLSDIPLSVLEASPKPGKWSVAQIFYHLNKAESLSVLYVSKKRLDVNNLKRTGLREQLMLMLVQLRFALPFALKAPAVLGDMPAKVDYNSVVNEWNTTREKMKELLTSLPDDMLYKNIFKQPNIGRINIFQMLDFMQAHFDRHQKQVESIVK